MFLSGRLGFFLQAVEAPFWASGPVPAGHAADARHGVPATSGALPQLVGWRRRPPHRGEGRGEERCPKIWVDFKILASQHKHGNLVCRSVLFADKQDKSRYRICIYIAKPKM